MGSKLFRVDLYIRSPGDSSDVGFQLIFGVYDQVKTQTSLLSYTDSLGGLTDFRIYKQEAPDAQTDVCLCCSHFSRCISSKTMKTRARQPVFATKASST